jgi:hypothetical protein
MRLVAGSTAMKIMVSIAAFAGAIAIVLFMGCYPTRSEILSAARTDYDFGRPRPPKDTTLNGYDGPTVPDSLAPAMTIETMTLKSSATANSLYQLLARIQSDRDYPPLKIRRGDNYLYRVIGGSKWITHDSTTFPRRLKHHAPLDSLATPPSEPMLVRITTNSIAFVACLEGCSSGHCSYR